MPSASRGRLRRGYVGKSDVFVFWFGHRHVIELDALKSAIWLPPELFLENLIKFVEVFDKIVINRLLALAVILAITAILIAIVKQKLRSL